jgi:hypothetical protein
MMDTETGEILDDAQGYGFKTPQKAYAAYHYKYGGGKQKHDDAKKYWKDHPEIEKFCQKWFEWNFKEYGRGEVSQSDLRKEIKEEFGVDVPMGILKKI